MRLVNFLMAWTTRCVCTGERDPDDDLLQEQLAKRDAEMVPSFLFTLGRYCFRIRGSGLIIGP